MPMFWRPARLHPPGWANGGWAGRDGSIPILHRRSNSSYEILARHIFVVRLSQKSACLGNEDAVTRAVSFPSLRWAGMRMRLLLTVLGTQRSTLGDRSSHVFETSGGTIGRSASCDWSLPNASNTLSARHAVISYNGHGFVVTDTSTNGVYVNTVDAPLGRDQSHALTNGDMLYIGDYVLSVAVLKELPPVAAETPVRQAPPAPLLVPLAASPLPQAATSASARAPATGFALPPDIDFGLPVPPPARANPMGSAVPSSTASAMTAAFGAPENPTAERSSPASTLIPDDFDFSDLAPGRSVPPPPAQWPVSPAPSLPSVALGPPANAPGAPSPSLDPLALLRQRAIARAASIDLSPPPVETAPLWFAGF
ncbi:MAG: hypothetical protein B7Z40_01895 [Bosea sp. 12-68-7]|nr:MAG: hypothetical protein B7Z40_01895 [Bosea sp. 12-68-7]